MFNANDGKGSRDIEKIEYAIAHRDDDGVVVIPRRAGERDCWLIDRAILLPSDTTVILQNCKIKLSDDCRDNFFRTANCGLGIEDPAPVSNVHIRGEGHCVLEGADRPRATGDGNKPLADPCPCDPELICRLAKWLPPERRTVSALVSGDRKHSFGTDAGKEGESQYGDWRNIGVLFANCDHFSVSGIKIVNSHAWGLSFEACSYGRVERLEFFSEESLVLDGVEHSVKNQDGVDLRNGCHHIVISDITGQTADDVIALTAIKKDKYTPGGSLRSTHVMHSDWSRRESGIHDVVIRNVCARAAVHSTVRLLPVNTKIYNIVIDGVINTTADGQPQVGRGLLLGTPDGAYGVNLPDGLSNITVSNVICNNKKAIDVQGYLTDSVICNVINKNPAFPAINVEREGGLKNVVITNVITVGE